MDEFGDGQAIAVAPDDLRYEKRCASHGALRGGVGRRQSMPSALPGVRTDRPRTMGGRRADAEKKQDDEGLGK